MRIRKRVLEKAVMVYFKLLSKYSAARDSGKPGSLKITDSRTGFEQDEQRLVFTVLIPSAVMLIIGSKM